MLIFLYSMLNFNMLFGLGCNPKSNSKILLADPVTRSGKASTYRCNWSRDDVKCCLLVANLINKSYGTFVIGFSLVTNTVDSHTTIVIDLCIRFAALQICKYAHVCVWAHIQTISMNMNENLKAINLALLYHTTQRGNQINWTEQNRTELRNRKTRSGSLIVGHIWDRNGWMDICVCTCVCVWKSELDGISSACNMAN